MLSERVPSGGPPALVERQALLDRLAAARDTGGRLIFVGGEAGIGKTALVRSFVAQSAGRTLAGACEHLATPAPLGPFADVAVELRGPLAETVEAGRHPRDVAMALLEELRIPTVLVIEDAHWADEATLDVLRVVARRIAETPSLVVVTFRDEVPDDHPLRILLGDLASAPAVERLEVPPLTPEAVCGLAAPHAADCAAIFALTAGNSFFVTELLGAGGNTLPPTVRDAVLARAARLSAPARSLLECAALVPARVELWLLEAAFPEEARHLDECVTSGMLEAGRGMVSFRHELARLAIESTVPPHRRRELHAAILLALESSPLVVDSSRLAHHADEAGDSEAVLRHGLAAAARGVRAGAHREAAAQYARVIRHAGAAPSAERANLLSDYACEAQACGLYDETIRGLLEAISIRRELGDILGVGDALARLTTPYVTLGRNDEAEEASRASIEALEALPPSHELAIAYGFQAYMRMLSRDNAEAVGWGQKSVELARRFEEPDTVSRALNMIGAAHVMSGDTSRGIRYLEQSLEVAEEHDLEYRIAHVHWMLGSGLAEMYELERGERALRAHIAFAAEWDHDSDYTQAWLAAVLVYRGLWTEGSELALEVLGARPAPVAEITANVVLGRVRARRGDPGALAALDAALAQASPGGHLQRLGHVHAARAEAAWLAGDCEQAAREARDVYPLALEKRHLWFAGELAYWQWKTSALGEVPEWIAEPYRLQIEGKPREAAAAWRDRGCPFEAARALAESECAVDVGSALEEFERLEAGPSARLARERLRALGATVPRGPRPATRANPANLTPRELEVLRLVADGMRNADVAEKLVVSRRTIDHHVAAVLRKLDAKTRGEAAAAAAGLGLLQDR